MSDDRARRIAEIVRQEHEAFNGDTNDVVLWFGRHGADPAPGIRFEHLSGARALSRYALLRAATEIWHELDPTRYAIEKADWEHECSAPYDVARRLFWARFRRYWNPKRGTGEVWLWHQKQLAAARRLHRKHISEQRLRGAEKRRRKEAQEIARLGLDEYNQRMARQKLESLHIRAAKVDRTSKEFLQFLEWRRSNEGRSYDKRPHFDSPDVLPSAPSINRRSHTVATSLSTSADLYRFLQLLTEQKRALFECVAVTLVSTADPNTVPVPFVLLNGKPSRLDGSPRLPDIATVHILRTMHNGLYGWGATGSVFRSFPERWRKYEGLEPPFGNPRLAAKASIVRRIEGCLHELVVTTPTQQIVIKVGARACASTPLGLLEMYFEDPFERARREALVARQERKRERKVGHTKKATTPSTTPPTVTHQDG